MNGYDFYSLPLGTSDFHVLRECGQIYVDKTDLIFELAVRRGKFFLTRPRRFGKTLLVSIFESLFGSGLLDFKGLKIEKLWQDRQYDVLRLDFSKISDCASAEAFEREFVKHISRKIQKLDSDFTCHELSDFDSWLESRSDNALVLLIDEYDAPLTTQIGNPELFEGIQRILSAFYSYVKGNDRALRFVFFTGITKFNKTSIFSKLNNLIDISLNPKFGSLLGYTQEEILYNFDSYLGRAERMLRISRKELIKQMRSHYDGFCFDELAAVHVYAPWSVLNFLDDPGRGFLNYWFESGGQPQILLEYFKMHAIKSPLDYAQERRVQRNVLNAASDLKTLKDDVLMLQAGYLTIEKVEGTTFSLKFPNEEVASSMATLYSEVLLSKDAVNTLGTGHLKKCLMDRNADRFVQELNRIFLGLDYTRFPVTSEANCAAVIEFILFCSQVMPMREVHNALGRSDMEFDIGKEHWVIELKYADRKSLVSALCEKGAEQMLMKKYGQQFPAERLLQLVLVFCGESRQFECWQLCGQSV